jgi:hypothetical protein
MLSAGNFAGPPGAARMMAGGYAAESRAAPHSARVTAGGYAAEPSAAPHSAGVTAGGYATEPSAAPHMVARFDRGRRAERGVGHSPAAAAHADRTHAGHAPGEHHPPRARRPHRLPAGRREVHSAVLPAGEGVWPEVEVADGPARHRRRPARTGVRGGGRQCDGDGGGYDGRDVAHAGTLSRAAPESARRASVIAFLRVGCGPVCVSRRGRRT